jgi:hypothetical protein
MPTTLNNQVLDRRKPSDWKHAEKYRYRAIVRTEVTTLPASVLLNVPRQYRQLYDQGQEGACVAYSESWAMSIVNRTKYHAPWLYNEAQLVDEFTDTPPEAGTSLRAGFDVLRTKGHRQVWGSRIREADEKHGIVANRWATTVDEIRAALAGGTPVVLGINWYRQFSSPEQRTRLDDMGHEVAAFGILRYDYWIGNIAHWGPVDGGHAIAVVGYDDARAAFALCNTWGFSYPFIVWLPYSALLRLLGEEGEAGIITDR